MFSTSTKEIVINTLHCRIPLVNIPIGTWINLSIDILSFVSECFKSQTFRSIDYLCITANCKIRRIFSMRNSLTEWNKTSSNEEFPMEYGEILPKNLSLPCGVQHQNINLNIDKIRQYLLDGQEATQSGQFNQVKAVIGLNQVQSGNKNYKEGVSATNTNNINDDRHFNSDSSPFIKNKNANNIDQKQVINSCSNNVVTDSFICPKKSNANKKIARNSRSPYQKIQETRSKSENRPLKNRDNYHVNYINEGGELMNKQEFLKDDIRFMSKSPDGDDHTDEDNSVKIETNRFNKNNNNQLIRIEMMKNNFKNVINNKNNLFNLKKPIKLNKDIASAKYQIQAKNKPFKIKNPVGKSKLHAADLNNLNLNTDDKETNHMLLNTLNYKNIEKWEMSKDNMADSIEEIFEVEEKKNINNWENNNYNININLLNTHSNDKNKTDESDEKFYYDIPIKDKKTTSNYKDSSNFFNSNTKFNKYKESSSVIGDNINTLDTKRQIIAEILKESQNTLTIIDRERPFTPPFTKLVPMSSLQSIDKSNVILERAKEETLNSDIQSSEIMNNNVMDAEIKSQVYRDINESFNKSNLHLKTGEIKTQHDIDLIYDHVLGCYYDPKTNMYYELKNN